MWGIVDNTKTMPKEWSMKALWPFWCLPSCGYIRFPRNQINIYVIIPHPWIWVSALYLWLVILVSMQCHHSSSLSLTRGFIWWQWNQTLHSAAGICFPSTCPTEFSGLASGWQLQGLFCLRIPLLHINTLVLFSQRLDWMSQPSHFCMPLVRNNKYESFL